MVAHRYVLLALLAILALVPPLALLLDEPFYVSLATRIMIYALAALSLDLVLGFGGMVSFGHAAFFGLGAYVVAILAQHELQGPPLVTWPFVISGTGSALVAWPLAAFASGLFALATGAICLRTSGISFIMITLAFAQMLYYLFTSLREYGGDQGMTLWSRSSLGPIDLEDDVSFHYLVLALLLASLFLAGRLVASRFGSVLSGTRDNDRRMQALGFSTYRYKLVAYAISGCLCGLAGALVANQTEFVSPSFLHWTRSGEILIMVILGGIGTLVGPILGAVALLLLEEILSSHTVHWQIVLGPVLILIVLFARRGLYGLLVRKPGHD